ncbi:MAG: LPS export ABC transporter periplasmic protein LptC [Betaproteobacteria bacterium]|nr:LPS export ABC transporter periplasmic protein LptC [Betaproteobacteria bacterium]
MMGMLLRLWDRLSIYLPVALMGVLALMSYWLVRNTPMFAAPPAQQALRHDPDYSMRRFTVRNFDAAGRLKNEMSGDRVQHYPDTDTLEIEQARIRGMGASGQITRASADRALSNADGSEVQLIGNARVVRDAASPGAPPLQLNSEFLHAFINDDRVRSHKPVTLLRGADRIEGGSLDYNDRDKVLELRGDVRAVLAPRGTTAAPR